MIAGPEDIIQAEIAEAFKIMDGEDFLVFLEELRDSIDEWREKESDRRIDWS